MSENAFTQAEAALVDDILIWASYGLVMWKDSPQFIARIKAYAQPEDQEAAAQAVIQLVKERLNAFS
jgi:hypothetical protein